ncbi:hypothetical protein B4U80_13699 [Leptotrombidium deliense]|uniref:dUTPase-like domain-containing protein n=1 Tax=Leptotrombidium deliense TaxID=299467 RepID=A0A443SK14_9ACAR|nr:hypothetical protein B4U80_13699 [Leptotrombidium deliense]
MDILCEKWTAIDGKEETDAAIDLYCAVDGSIAPGETKKILMDNKYRIPRGFYGTIHPYPQISLTSNLVICNTTVDSLYTGNIYIVAHLPRDSPLFNFNEDL